MKKVFIDDMTRVEFKEMLETAKVAVIPTGSTEQHGPHLPLKVDIANTVHIVRKAAENLYPQVVVTPPVAVGVSPHHMNYPGTLSLRYETFINIILDLCASLKRHGINKVAIVNGHGGNEAPCSLAGRRARDKLSLKVVVIPYWSLIPKEVTDSLLETGIMPGHACEFETSLGLAIYPELISKEIPRAVKAPWRLKGLIGDTDEETGDGYAGDPSVATREKGERLIEAAVQGVVSLLQDFITKVE